MSWRSVSAFDGGDNAAPAHIGPHLSRQGATPCRFGQPLRTFHSCRSAHEDNTGRRKAQKSALDVGEPATQCTGEGGRAVHGQGERRAHQFLHLALCSARWLLGHPPYFASRCKAGSLMCWRTHSESSLGSCAQAQSHAKVHCKLPTRVSTIQLKPAAGELVATDVYINLRV